ncbi:nucleotidyltransferase domain-containing protein [candidate division KSB1 bacterium]|nr:nucleotidyltransferase domain-containing protein [candidate division KSB1 bacterium]
MKRSDFLSTNEKNALAELVKILKDKHQHQLCKIKLFGSKIRGNYDEASDIDVFIVFDRRVDWKFKDQIFELIFEINLRYNVFISARIYSKSRLQEERIKTLPFIRNVLQNGVDLL